MTNQELINFVMAHRYLYYVLCKPVITDYEYDQLESRALKVIDDPNHSINFPGSSLEKDYSPEIIAIARTLR